MRTARNKNASPNSLCSPLCSNKMCKKYCLATGPLSQTARHRGHSCPVPQCNFSNSLSAVIVVSYVLGLVSILLVLLTMRHTMREMRVRQQSRAVVYYGWDKMSNATDSCHPGGAAPKAHTQLCTYQQCAERPKNWLPTLPYFTDPDGWTPKTQRTIIAILWLLYCRKCSTIAVDQGYISIPFRFIKINVASHKITREALR